MSTRVAAKSSPISALARTLLAPAVWLERARGRRRLALACLYIVVIGLCGFLLWWATSLSGLPDIGMPFDATRFDGIRVPDDENAFVLYRQAGAQRVLLDPEVQPLYKANQSWSQAAPDIRDWVRANSAALRLWKRAAARSRALYMPPRELSFESNMEVILQLRDLTRVADVEGSRLEELGDLAGAWSVYGSMLRSSRHMGLFGSAVQRLVGMACLRISAPRILAWSRHPLVSASQIREALAEVVACEQMTPPASQSLEIEYLSLMKAFDEPKRLAFGDPAAEQYWYRHIRGGPEAELFLFREPERSRRVVQLVFANWLAYCDRPPSQRPKTSTEINLFEPDSTTPAPTHVLSSAALQRWNETTLFAKQFLPAFANYGQALDAERGLFAGLKVHLAEQLYLREHGKAPQKLGDLVGPYLERLPDGYDDSDISLGEPDDESAAKQALPHGSQKKTKP